MKATRAAEFGPGRRCFQIWLFQHLSVLLLKHKDYQSFSSLVLSEGSPGTRRRPASGRGPYLSINPPTHSPTQPSTHPPPSPSSCLAQFCSPGLKAAREGRRSVVWPAPGTGPVLPRGCRVGRPGTPRGVAAAEPSLSEPAPSGVPVPRDCRLLPPPSRAHGPGVSTPARARLVPVPRRRSGGGSERAKRPGGAGESGGCRGRLCTAARVAVA